MTQPFESSMSDATAAADVYVNVTAAGTTIATVHANLNALKLKEDPAGPLYNDWSDDFVTRGVNYLVAAGLVTSDGTTLTPVHLVNGATRAIRRAANKVDIEIDPTARVQDYGWVGVGFGS